MKEEHIQALAIAIMYITVIAASTIPVIIVLLAVKFLFF